MVNGPESWMSIRHAFQDPNSAGFQHSVCKLEVSSVMSIHQPLSDADVLALVRRMELEPKLLRRHLEEQIIALVPLEDCWLEESRSSFLNGRPLDDCLQEKVG